MSFLYDMALHLEWCMATFDLQAKYSLEISLHGHRIGVKKIRLFSSALRFEWRLLIQFNFQSQRWLLLEDVWKSTFIGSNLTEG